MEKKAFCIVVPTSFMMRYFQGQLRFLNETFEVTVISSDPEFMESFGRVEGIGTCCIPITRYFSVGKDLLSFWRLYRYFRKHRPYLVHGNTAKALLIMSAAKFAGVPVRVYMAHGSLHQGYTGIRRTMVKLLERAICRCSTEILCVGFRLKDLLFREHICGRNAPVKVVGNGSVNGIDTSRFDRSLFNRTRLRSELHISPDTFVFCFVGRINREKGINELVSAFKKMVERYRDVSLLLVGPKEEYRSIDENIQKEIDSNRLIHSFGYQEDVRPYMAISDTFVLPSHREGLNLTLIEAGAMGIPCITTDIIGCNEIVIDGVTGRLVPARDEESLGVMLEWFYEHRDDELKKMGECARQSIAERYEQHNTWAAYRDEYTSL